MCRVLLVEDHEEIWDFLSRRLTRRGYEVILAHDGEQGIFMARSCEPGIILLDLNMPVMSGLDAAKILKTDARTSGIPIIALTAHAMSGDRAVAIAAGCDDYHAKPINFTQLITQMEALTRRTDRSAANRSDTAILPLMAA